MPLKLTKKKAELSGDVLVDDAETLFHWLAAHAGGTVVFDRLTHMHTAVLQALAARPGRLKALPDDPFLADCLRQLTSQKQEN
ncbi:hypothetical protein [Gellertiella hungarica]|uniref:Uncharacterized protein n=1 Tax=Gellertiella hungarica TaxID=1572859 RepID=A0A7W6J766_9HYPH|nr:hypothetical protein [Gellertiella hungarica]MBB4066071.1 hypothetical protein [Gellertiella hungarica]